MPSNGDTVKAWASLPVSVEKTLDLRLASFIAATNADWNKSKNTKKPSLIT